MRFRFTAALMQAMFLMNLALQGQVTDVSAPQKLSSKTPRFKVLGKNNDGYVVRLYGNEENIFVYDENLKIKSSRLLEMKGDKPAIFHIQLNKSGGVIYYSTHDKKNAAIFAQPVNGKFTESGRAVLIDSLLHDNNFQQSNVRVAFSSDQSHLAIYFPLISNSGINGLRMLILDRALGLRFAQTLPLQVKAEQIEAADCLLDNNGRLVLALNFKEGDKNKPSPDYFSMYVCDPESGIFGTWNYRSPKPVFGETLLRFDSRNRQLIACGFYEEEEENRSEASASGIFYARLEPSTGEVIRESWIPFPSTFIRDLTGRDNAPKKLYTFSMKDAIIRLDGGALLLAESFVKDSREYITPTQFNTPFNSFRTINIYQYNDLIAFSLDSNAVADWYSVMPKKQVSEDDNGAYSSFLLMNQKSHLNLLYLDEISSSGSLMNYRLESNGQKSKKAILDQGLKEVMLLPKLGKQVSPSEAIIPSYLRNALRLIRITY
jgi:hypothetical protein